jgi:hypothetical protein
LLVDEEKPTKINLNNMKKKELIEKISRLEKIIEDKNNEKRQKEWLLINDEIESFKLKMEKLGVSGMNIQMSAHRDNFGGLCRKIFNIEFYVMS